jgi:hypothetical protein
MALVLRIELNRFTLYSTNLNHPPMMKKLLRPLAGLLTALMLVSCASPYQAEMGALHHAYMNGQVSRDEYDREMARLHVNDAGWQQANANNVATGVAIGAVALGTAALLSDDHHHHRYYHHRRYHHHGW